ncbi:MAG: hypothetical protein ACE362_25410, partial [Phaeodactylibacter xiamenensis]|uniref:hypothetical protein n=1 Tax=Phaeodactylibacter xiamenensis TaxID=1524460 RepID=UPI003919B5E8
MTTGIKVTLGRVYISVSHLGYILPLLLGFWIVEPGYSQLHDYNWILGYDGGVNMPVGDSFGLVKLSFLDESLELSANEQGEGDFRSNNVSFSDGSASLRLYFTGEGVYNSEYELMPNGANWYSGQFDGGWKAPQASLCLPHPGNVGYCILLNMETELWAIEEELSITGKYLFSSMIKQDTALADIFVSLRKELLLSDTLDYGKLSACRHANGRDWWVILPAFNSNLYYRYLLTPSGIDLVGVQEIGEAVPTGLGQALFSPDGTKHIRFNGISEQAGEFTTIYDFDRCTGLLSNFLQFNYPIGGSGGGAFISKNARYLYTSSTTTLYQYDLWAEDIEATRTLVADYDGHLDPLPTTFF